MSYDELLRNFKDILKNSSLKYTKQREYILEALYTSHHHHTPEEIYRLIQSKYPKIKIGIATVYRTLSLLEDANLVSSLSVGDQGKRYELLSHEHHDHLVCIKCNRIMEFHDAVIEKRQEIIAKEFNFKMTDHTMQIIGICQECQKR
ncbi:MAG: transcriptional repressor [Campylobacterales bacterium]|nr:transcriptional repressor [Campylobacterales bacterium]